MDATEDTPTIAATEANSGGAWAELCQAVRSWAVSHFNSKPKCLHLPRKFESRLRENRPDLFDGGRRPKRLHNILVAYEAAIFRISSVEDLRDHPLADCTSRAIVAEDDDGENAWEEVALAYEVWLTTNSRHSYPPNRLYATQDFMRRLRRDRPEMFRGVKPFRILGMFVMEYDDSRDGDPIHLAYEGQ